MNAASPPPGGSAGSWGGTVADMPGLSRDRHMLNSRFTLSFWRRNTTNRAELYGSSIKDIGTFGSVEEFWAYYTHLVKPNDLAVHTDYYLFRDLVKPLWEDPANKNGGRWTIRINKGIANRAFEDMSMLLVGEQLDDAETVCGIALSIRFQEDVLSLWTRTSVDKGLLESIRDTAQSTLAEYITDQEWEFKRHAAG